MIRVASTRGYGGNLLIIMESHGKYNVESKYTASRSTEFWVIIHQPRDNGRRYSSSGCLIFSFENNLVNYYQREIPDKNQRQNLFDDEIGICLKVLMLNTSCKYGTILPGGAPSPSAAVN